VPRTGRNTLVTRNRRGIRGEAQPGEIPNGHPRVGFTSCGAGEAAKDGDFQEIHVVNHTRYPLFCGIALNSQGEVAAIHVHEAEKEIEDEGEDRAQARDEGGTPGVADSPESRRC